MKYNAGRGITRRQFGKVTALVALSLFLHGCGPQNPNEQCVANSDNWKPLNNPEKPFEMPDFEKVRDQILPHRSNILMFKLPPFSETGNRDLEDTVMPIVRGFWGLVAPSVNIVLYPDPVNIQLISCGSSLRFNGDDERILRSGMMNAFSNEANGSSNLKVMSPSFIFDSRENLGVNFGSAISSMKLETLLHEMMHYYIRKDIYLRGNETGRGKTTLDNDQIFLGLKDPRVNFGQRVFGANAFMESLGDLGHLSDGAKIIGPFPGRNTIMGLPGSPYNAPGELICDDEVTRAVLGGNTSPLLNQYQVALVNWYADEHAGLHL